MSDWIAASLVFGAMMFAVYIGWNYFPRPRANGGLILGAVAVASTLVFFAKSKAAMPIWPRALGFAVMVLMAQFALQAFTALGILKR